MPNEQSLKAPFLNQTLWSAGYLPNPYSGVSTRSPNILTQFSFLSAGGFFFFFFADRASQYIYIVVINQLDAQNLFYNKFISCLYMFRAPCAHRQEVKIVLYSLWYHHTFRWLSHAQVFFFFFFKPEIQA